MIQWVQEAGKCFSHYIPLDGTIIHTSSRRRNVSTAAHTYANAVWSILPSTFLLNPVLSLHSYSPCYHPPCHFPLVGCFHWLSLSLRLFLDSQLPLANLRTSGPGACWESRCYPWCTWATRVVGRMGSLLFQKFLNIQLHP